MESTHPSERKSADHAAFACYLRTGRRLTAAEWLAEECKFNPNHDPDHGRFTLAPGGASQSRSRDSTTSRLANGGKPYPARIDLRPYPVRNPIPASRTDRPARNAKSPAPPAIRFKHRDNLDLPALVIDKANSLSDAVHLRTGYGIVVTSGFRGPDRQARAMYNNYADGTSKPYGNATTEGQVKRAFYQGQKARRSRNQIIEDMADVLREQVARGIFLSRHMRSGAIDIEKPPRNVLQSIRSHPSVQSVLAEDDHIHIQFR